MEPLKPGMVVVQLHSFDRAAKDLLREERVQEIVGELALRPEAGDLIEGTGGVRKVRFGVDGRGKSGGVRVVYLFRDTTMPLFLITVFAKNDMPNLTKAQRNAMGGLVDGLVADWQARLLAIAAAAKDGGCRSRSADHDHAAFFLVLCGVQGRAGVMRGITGELPAS